MLEKFYGILKLKEIIIFVVVTKDEFCAHYSESKSNYYDVYHLNYLAKNFTPIFKHKMKKIKANSLSLIVFIHKQILHLINRLIYDNSLWLIIV